MNSHRTPAIIPYLLCACIHILTLHFPSLRLRGHRGGEHLPGHGGGHLEVELAALRLQVGPPAGHALPVRGLQPGHGVRRAVRAQQGATHGRHTVRLPAGEMPQHTHTQTHTDTRTLTHSHRQTISVLLLFTRVGFAKSLQPANGDKVMES